MNIFLNVTKRRTSLKVYYKKIIFVSTPFTFTFEGLYCCRLSSSEFKESLNPFVG